MDSNRIQWSNFNRKYYNGYIPEFSFRYLYLYGIKWYMYIWYFNKYNNQRTASYANCTWNRDLNTPNM